MMTEQHYYWKLIAVRHSTDSEVLKFVKVPASIGKIPGLKAAMIDFQNEMGPCWEVTHQALSEQYFEMRTQVRKRDDARLVAICNGFSIK